MENERILFNRVAITELFDENNRRIRDDLCCMDCNELRKANIKELADEVYQRHKVRNISLDMAGMRIMKYDSNHVKVGIPIEEGEQLLDVIPVNDFGFVHPVGAVEDGMVTKIFTLSKSRMDHTKRQIGIWRDVLDVYSNSMDEDIIHYHKHLLKDIEDWIKDLRADCADLGDRVKDLSRGLGIKNE